MPDTSVKYFHSSMSGAPTLSGSAGSLITVLDACLVNGFSSVTLDSLVVSGNVATATISTGHNLEMVGTVGPVVRIEGATPSGLNGDWRLASVPNSTTFTFATTGISDQTASGTITAKRAPAGFSKAFSGTNKAAYRADDLASTRLYLRVDDSPAQYPTLIMYEAMSDVDTGTGLAPTSGSLYFGKSSAANSTARSWRLYADARCFYLCAKNDGTNWYGAFFFGDLAPLLSSDAYHCGLIGHDSAGYSSSHLHEIYVSVTSAYLARSYTQLGAAIGLKRGSNARSGSYLGSAGATYPNPAGNLLLVAPVDAWEGTAQLICRGIMPGLWNPLHRYSALTEGAAVTGIMPGAKTGLIQYLQSIYAAVFDLTGPWR